MYHIESRLNASLTVFFKSPESVLVLTLVLIMNYLYMYSVTFSHNMSSV